ncbi:hypothetical protein B4U79_18576 [Dinothrombium tinctorium]|uniref:DM domain-containing protein n=1 Tax=Dinothrombium tinctorium TaxID=1965070 RepID=A0A3S3NYR4_9ACAR|nr:hypothetical protein B4U79_18576 [Dinothrombium tinctorium]
MLPAVPPLSSELDASSESANDVLMEVDSIKRSVNVESSGNKVAESKSGLCLKCQLHGKEEQIKNHKKFCPYEMKKCRCVCCEFVDKVKQTRKTRKKNSYNVNEIQSKINERFESIPEEWLKLVLIIQAKCKERREAFYASKQWRRFNNDEYELIYGGNF